MHNCYRGPCPERECRSLQMMAAIVEKSWEVLWCWGIIAEAVVPVPGKPVRVPQSRKSPVAKWYRFHTYWYRHQHVIFVGFEQNSNFGPRARSSFDNQLEFTKEKGIKAKERVEKGSF